MHHDTHVTDATPEQVHAWLTNGEILLVDVREPNEYAFERIHGALLYPLSTFDAGALPTEGRKLVLHCGSGKRSLTAAHKLQAAGPRPPHAPGGRHPGLEGGWPARHSHRPPDRSRHRRRPALTSQPRRALE
jgi:rhodanese-related sulfurtransferase